MNHKQTHEITTPKRVCLYLIESPAGAALPELSSCAGAAITSTTLAKAPHRCSTTLRDDVYPSTYRKVARNPNVVYYTRLKHEESPINPSYYVTRSFFEAGY